MAAKSDPGSLGDLLRKHDPMMRAVAYRIVGSEALDDVLQDAYLRAIKAYPNFEGRSAFRTWLFRIVHNTSVDFIRKSQRRPATVAVEAMPFEPVSVHGQGQIEAQQALAELPLDQRTALTLVGIVGLDYAEAAELLGVPQGTVASRVHRARSALREELSRVDLS